MDQTAPCSPFNGLKLVGKKKKVFNKLMATNTSTQISMKQSFTKLERIIKIMVNEIIYGHMNKSRNDKKKLMRSPY